MRRRLSAAARYAATQGDHRLDGRAVVWTTDRLLVWGGRWRARVYTDGAAYTP